MRSRRGWLILALLGVVCALPVMDATTEAQNPDPEQERIVRGFLISPVKLKLRGRDRNLIGLGSYIVNAPGACNGCHTNPPYAEGGDPFLGQPEQINTAGYLAGGVEFGPFVSRNLTPGEHRLPAGMLFRDFKRTMRTGHDLKNLHPHISPLMQVMPWPEFGKMTDRDLKAVYEFLRAIPSIESP